MKGIVFSEFLDMVEGAHGIETVDRLIEDTQPPSGGVYTTVGTYEAGELVAMVTRLAELTGSRPADLVKSFGGHLYGIFKGRFPEFFKGHVDVFSFLSTIETVIHVEVKKLYPDAILPTFTCHWQGKAFVMDYRSRQNFADLAEGLIGATLRDFGVAYGIHRADGFDGEICTCRFTLSKI